MALAKWNPPDLGDAVARVATLLARRLPPELAAAVLRFVGAPALWLACARAREPFTLPLPTNVASSWRLATMCRRTAEVDDIWAVRMFAQALKIRTTEPVPIGCVAPQGQLPYGADLTVREVDFYLDLWDWARRGGDVAEYAVSEMPIITSYLNSQICRFMYFVKLLRISDPSAVLRYST